MKYHYVYQILDTKEDKKYIGARSSSVKPENDLGVRYFSCSSNKQFKADQHADPKRFTYKVLSVHSTRQEAIDEEIRLHHLYNVEHNEQYYNKRRQSHQSFDNHGREFWHNIHTLEVKAVLKSDAPLDASWVKGFHKDSSGVNGKIWICNETTSKEQYIDPHDSIPDGWRLGRLGANTKGKRIAYNETSKEHKYFGCADAVPDGWVLGNYHAQQSGYKLFYNPESDSQIYVWQGDNPPPGYKPGVRPRSSHANTGRIQYSNKASGQAVYLQPGETPPPGFIKGGLGLMKDTKTIRNRVTGERTRIHKDDNLPSTDWVYGEGTRSSQGKSKYVNLETSKIEYHKEGTQPKDRVPLKGFRRYHRQPIKEAVAEYLSKL